MGTRNEQHDLAWWQRGVVYEVYPRSFQDSDGDGVGDLQGVLSRLDHFAELGVDAVWICPIQPSPMADFGYDLSEHCDVDPVYGGLEDFDRLVAAAHVRGIRVILDYVSNHTSDRHPWFRQSRSSRTDPRRDWYVWRDPEPDSGGPPSNWLGNLGGGAWTFDAGTGQYYLHSFLPEQPNLNWRNPEVREAMFEVMRFWLRRGVDGLRVDAIRFLVQDELLRDDPPNPGFQPGTDPRKRLRRVFSADRPETLGAVAGMRCVLDEFPDRVLISEAYLPPSRLVRYYGRSRPGAHLPFNFHLIGTPWHARCLEAAIDEYVTALPSGAWPNWVLGNHDKRRLASRVGSAQARVAAMLLLTLRGTPFLYYGDEIGMEDAPIPPERMKDPMARLLPDLDLGRDPQRAPMPWDGSAPNGGFTGGTPWVPLPADWRSRNVAAQRADPHSLLNLHRRLIAVRRRERALLDGAYVPVPNRGNVLAYERRDGAGGARFLVALNLGGSEARLPLPAPGRVEVSTGLDRDGEGVQELLTLRGDEGLLVRLGGG